MKTMTPILKSPSQHESPFPYVIDGLNLDRSMSADLTRFFPTTELSQIGDETADGLTHATEFYPLSHFDARRVDFPLARLRHYTGDTGRTLPAVRAVHQPHPLR
jgi:AMP nucleosidase